MENQCLEAEIKQLKERSLDTTLEELKKVGMILPRLR